jgi:hypothetical protein
MLFAAAGEVSAKDLTCDVGGSTSITWEPYKKKWETSEKIASKVDEQYSIKLVNVGAGVPSTRKPALVGNGGAADLTLIEGGPEKFVYLETTLGGNAVLWTLVPAKKDGTPSYDTVISTKTYTMIGPVSYTTMYSCK